LRDEVDDLQSAGIGIIQVDEPALREGLPLRGADRPAYLQWAVDAFLLATAVAHDEVQVHTHMCYAEFEEFLDAIVRMEADVISLEAARWNMQILEAFAACAYPNGIGLGVYDIHSPCVPGAEEIEARIRPALGVFRIDQFCVNPDCGF
jgi:5-methyltetrahydropteroyltriglutamate--homocysteine methyltransferase